MIFKCLSEITCIKRILITWYHTNLFGICFTNSSLINLQICDKSHNLHLHQLIPSLNSCSACYVSKCQASYQVSANASTSRWFLFMSYVYKIWMYLGIFGTSCLYIYCKIIFKKTVFQKKFKFYYKKPIFLIISFFKSSALDCVTINSKYYVGNCRENM